MKKLFYFSAMALAVSLFIYSCGKDDINRLNDTEKVHKVKKISSISEIDFSNQNNVLHFKSWDDIFALSDYLVVEIEENSEEFDKKNKRLLDKWEKSVESNLNKKGAGSKEDILLAYHEKVDSLEHSQGFFEFHPLNEFSGNHNRKNLWTKIDDIVFRVQSDASEEEKYFWDTYPVPEEMMPLFSEEAMIAVEDSTYRVLHNNVWLAVKIGDESLIRDANHGNYEYLKDKTGVKVYDEINAKSSKCRSNGRNSGRNEAPNTNYQVRGVITVTNVPFIKSRYIKSISRARRKSHNGNRWRRWRTQIQALASANAYNNRRCEPGHNEIDVRHISCSSSHSRRSSRVCRARLDYAFRVKTDEFYTYHRAGRWQNTRAELFLELN